MNNNIYNIFDQICRKYNNYLDGFINDIDFMGDVHDLTRDYLKEQKDGLEEKLNIIEDYI